MLVDQLDFEPLLIIIFHFDEKWIRNEYINSYVNIEPVNNELQSLNTALLNKNVMIQILDFKKSKDKKRQNKK